MWCLGGGEGWNEGPRAVCSGKNPAQDEGVYLPGDLTATQTSQDLLKNHRPIRDTTTCTELGGVAGAGPWSYLNNRKLYLYFQSPRNHRDIRPFNHLFYCLRRVLR